MADTLNIYGVTYQGVEGIKATDSNNIVLTYVRPQGTKTITENGTGIDVSAYATADVNVGGGSPTLETITKTYTPTTSQQTDTITPGVGYDGIAEVDVTVDAMPTGTEGTPTATKGAVSNHSVNVTPSVTNVAGYIAGGTKTGTAVTVSASELDSGTKSITANGNNQDVVGYAAVNVAVPNSYSAADEGKVVSSGALVAQTAHADVTPTTSDQTIDTTLNNSLKVKGDADLVAGNIKKDVEIFGVTGSYEGGGVNFDNYISNPPTFPSGEITFNGTSIRDYAFAYLAQDNSAASTWPEWSFYAPNATSIGANAFRQCRTLKQVRLPSLTSPASGSYFFYQATSGTRKLELIDWGEANIGGNWAGYCANLKTIILRKTTIATLGNISQAFQGTPFASGGSGGTIYIPKVLYDHLGDNSSSDYKAASNWSTVNGYGTITWARLEGSIYESPTWGH